MLVLSVSLSHRLVAMALSTWKHLQHCFVLTLLLLPGFQPRASQLSSSSAQNRHWRCPVRRPLQLSRRSCVSCHCHWPFYLNSSVRQSPSRRGSGAVSLQALLLSCFHFCLQCQFRASSPDLSRRRVSKCVPFLLLELYSLNMPNVSSCPDELPPRLRMRYEGKLFPSGVNGDLIPHWHY